jgi:hypothetical protein
MRDRRRHDGWWDRVLVVSLKRRRRAQPGDFQILRMEFVFQPCDFHLQFRPGVFMPRLERRNRFLLLSGYGDNHFFGLAVMYNPKIPNLFLELFYFRGTIVARLRRDFSTTAAAQKRADTEQGG